MGCKVVVLILLLIAVAGYVEVEMPIQGDGNKKLGVDIHATSEYNEHRWKQRRENDEREEDERESRVTGLGCN